MSGEQPGQVMRPPRFKVSVFVADGDHMGPLGQTRDMSVTGIFLETTTPPPVGTIVHIAIVWGDDTHVCAARTVRQAPGGVGLQYIDPGVEFLRAISEITGVA